LLFVAILSAYLLLVLFARALCVNAAPRRTEPSARSHAPQAAKQAPAYAKEAETQSFGAGATLG
jgi:hypothetical protein